MAPKAVTACVEFGKKEKAETLLRITGYLVIDVGSYFILFHILKYSPWELFCVKIVSPGFNLISVLLGNILTDILILLCKLTGSGLVKYCCFNGCGAQFCRVGSLSHTDVTLYPDTTPWRLKSRLVVTQVTHRRRITASRVLSDHECPELTAAIKFSSLIGRSARFSALSWVSRRYTGEWEKVFFPGQAKIYPVPLKWRAK